MARERVSIALAAAGSRGTNRHFSVSMGTAGYGDQGYSTGQSYGQFPVYSPAIYKYVVEVDFTDDDQSQRSSWFPIQSHRVI